MVYLYGSIQTTHTAQKRISEALRALLPNLTHRYRLAGHPEQRRMFYNFRQL